jgi:hypothetical protein
MPWPGVRAVTSSCWDFTTVVVILASRGLSKSSASDGEASIERVQVCVNALYFHLGISKSYAKLLARF